MAEVVEKLGMGWLPDFPDFRDFTVEQTDVPSRLKQLGQKSIKAMLAKAGAAEPVDLKKLPSSVNLTPWFSPVEDQGSLGSCTANAGVALVEYFESIPVMSENAL